LAGTAGEIFKECCINILGKNAKFWGKKQNFEFFSNFEADFGDPCYDIITNHEFWKLLCHPLKFFKKRTPKTFGFAHVCQD